MKLFAKFASGPLAFLLLYMLPLEGLEPKAQLVMAVFGWVILWWMTQPVPWAVTSFLPLILFPFLGVMNSGSTARLYGQNIFFFVWGTSLMGYAMQRHGLAKRFALWFLSFRWLNGHTHRLVFGFMMASGLISAFISDNAVVAIMIPMGMALVAYIRTLAGVSGSEKSQFGALMALGTLYGTQAGGKATIAGLPHNALAVALLEETTGRTLGWFNWMLAGVPIFLVTLTVYFFILRFFLPPEITVIPGGEELFRREREKLGPMTPGERGTLFIFLTMVLLFTLPTLVGLTLGSAHPLTQWTNSVLSIWAVPVVVLLLLFSVPVNWRKNEFVLNWREAVQHSPWDILFLVTAAVAIAGTLVDLGLVKFIGGWISGLGMGPYGMPFFSAYLVAFGTNFFSGAAATSFFGSILIPAAQQVGFNPASMAMLIANVAVGLMLPWAGAAAGTAFASGQIEMKNMIRVGVVATLIFPFLVAAIHILIAPIL
ncbi:MAG: SLC13 family permease [Acidobacteria bacterium]|nr:SLC13 family permease [Acidobacteriota bacterium]